MRDFTERQRLAAYVLLSALLVGGIMLLGKRTGRSPIVVYPGPVVDHDPQPGAEPELPKEPEAIVVHVCGAVKNPGVYSVPEDARIADAVRLAGGLLDTAAEESVNMAMRLSDSMQVYIPELPSSSEPVPLSSETTNAKAGTFVGTGTAGKVNINTATLSELRTLPGIGPALAQRIVEFRTAQGPFERPEDIMKVSGIGEKKYQDLKNSIMVY